VGQLPKNINGTPFPTLWKEIWEHHTGAFSIRLRPAANLIGHHLFPIGWKWLEYVPLSQQDAMPYEANALATIGCDMPSIEPKSESALQAIRAGIESRKQKVEPLLRRLIARKEVRYFARGRAFPRVEPEEGDPPNRPFDIRDFEWLDVSKSTMGARLYDRVHVELDALGLIERLIALTETRGRKERYPWKQIERHARVIIESEGLPAKNASLEQVLNKFVSDKHPGFLEPPSSKLQDLVSSLRAEYAPK
jgi:hypothetical protein